MQQFLCVSFLKLIGFSYDFDTTIYVFLKVNNIFYSFNDGYVLLLIENRILKITLKLWYIHV